MTDPASQVAAHDDQRHPGHPGRPATRVLTGLGWPETASPATAVPAIAVVAESVGGHRSSSTGLGWPQPARFPQNPQTHPQGGVDDPVSRETPPSQSVRAGLVPRETIAAAPTGPPMDLADLVDTPAPADLPAPPVSPEEHPVTSPDPSEASRFGPYPAPGTPAYRTAAEVAASVVVTADSSTPMAQSVEHHLLVTQGKRLGEPLPRPERARVMVVANQKGGVGKTTSTVNMAAALAQHGLRVLVIDLDPQGNASTALSVDHRRGTPSTYDALVDGVALEDVVQPVPDIDNLFVVPATIDLAGAEIELVSLVARESRLRKAIQAYAPVTSTEEDRIDYVLVDCPPSLGLLTLNALVAGEEMLIPIQAEYYALEGLGQLLETVEMVKAHLNPRLAVSTILLTMYDARTRLAAGVADEVRDHFGDQVLRTAIPRSVRISEAPSYGQTVMTYDPGSAGALSYLEAAREMALKGANA